METYTILKYGWDTTLLDLYLLLLYLLWSLSHQCKNRATHVCDSLIITASISAEKTVIDASYEVAQIAT